MSGGYACERGPGATSVASSTIPCSRTAACADFSSLPWIAEAQVQQVVAHDAEGLQIEHDHEVHVGFVIARDEQVLPSRNAHVPRIDDPVTEFVAIEFRRRDGVDVAPEVDGIRRSVLQTGRVL